MASTNATHQQIASEAPTLVSPSPTASKIVRDTSGGGHSHFRAPDRDGTLGPNAVIPAVVPPVHPFRTLVICFDGTGDQFDNDNSNVVKLFQLLKKDDRNLQMCYYQAGIGTYNNPQIPTPIGSKISKILDEMFAWNLDAHVMDGYEFLMQNYTAGDRICIFGFSRGAYTARALAGMLHKVGLLPACNHQQVPFAYKMYSRTDDLGWKQSNAFKRCFSIDVDVEFIGVWDTVQSVGLLDRRLPFTTSNTAVRTFRHAVALDEHRVKFKANLWNRPNPTEAVLGEELKQKKEKKKKNGGYWDFGSSLASSFYGTAATVVAEVEGPKKPKLKELERKFEKPRDKPTDIDEVWFTGCHCDVGGGAVEDDVEHALARIPLRWMIRECFKTNTGIMFDVDGLREIGLDPARLYPEVLPRPPPMPVSGARIARIPKKGAPPAPAPAPAPAASGPVSASTSTAPVHYADGEGSAAAPPRAMPAADGSPSATAAAGLLPVGLEEEEELHDALSPVYDQLSLARWWWLLELLPLKRRFQRSEDDKWGNEYLPNLGSARYIPKQKDGLRVHRSVKMRMDAEFEARPGHRYTPRPEFRVEPTWVD